MFEHKKKIKRNVNFKFVLQLGSKSFYTNDTLPTTTLLYIYILVDSHIINCRTQCISEFILTKRTLVVSRHVKPINTFTTGIAKNKSHMQKHVTTINEAHSITALSGLC